MNELGIKFMGNNKGVAKSFITDDCGNMVLSQVKVAEHVTNWFSTVQGGRVPYFFGKNVGASLSTAESLDVRGKSKILIYIKNNHNAQIDNIRVYGYLEQGLIQNAYREEIYSLSVLNPGEDVLIRPTDLKVKDISWGAISVEVWGDRDEITTGDIKVEVYGFDDGSINTINDATIAAPVDIQYVRKRIERKIADQALNVTPDGSYVVRFTPPVGEMWKVKVLGLNIPNPSGATTGKHTLDVFMGNASFWEMALNLESKFSDPLSIGANYFRTATQRQDPPDPAAQTQAILNLTATNDTPLLLRYINSTDTTQTSTATIRLVVEVIDIA